MQFLAELFVHFLFVLVFVFLFTAAISPLPFVQMGEQSSCLIRLQYLIYDREIMNVLSKWQLCGFLYFCRQYFFLIFENQPALKKRTELPCNL